MVVPSWLLARCLLDFEAMDSPELSTPPITQPSSPYLAPPWPRDESGKIRGVGLELELSNLTLEETLAIVHECVGGEVRQESPSEGRVEHTRFGKFKVELDSAGLKDRSVLRGVEKVGIDPSSALAQKVEESVIEVARTVVPIEVVTPPIPWNALHELDGLWARLREAGAADTRSSVLNAFGLHLNPRVPRTDVDTLLAIMRAFLLLEDWIVDEEDVDFTRRITPFIKQFPEAYRRKILQPEYKANLSGFVSDYLEHNPTRNRTLDLLPLFAHMGVPDLAAQVEDWSLVSPRPTFHYRLPNCELAQPGWTPAADWNRWVMVERLAQNPEVLRELSLAYLDTLDLPLRLQRAGWTEQVRSELERLGALV